MRIRTVLIVIVLAFFLTAIVQGDSSAHSKYKGLVAPEKLQKKEVVAEPATPTPEQSIVQAPDIKLVINIPAKKVSLYDNGKEVARHDIAVGQPVYKTPTGQQIVNQIIWNPWWIPPDSPWARGAEKAPPGPKNPLGPVKLLMGNGIRLHGTNKPSSIGTAASHGCLRMRNEDAASMAWYIQKRINVGTDETLFDKYSKYRSSSFYVNLDHPLNVEIIYDTVEFRDNTIYIYPDIYGWGKNVRAEIIEDLLKDGIDIRKVDEQKLSNIKYPKKNEVIEINIKDILT